MFATIVCTLCPRAPYETEMHKYGKKDFERRNHYISDMIEDRHIVISEDQYKVVYGLSVGIDFYTLSLSDDNAP